jgi:nitrite reductase/ring-hydroxylating ferredoxin subunit
VLVDLGDPAGRTAWTVTADDGRAFAVFSLGDPDQHADGGGLRVSDAACPHNAGPLVEGQVRAGEVRCPWHWYRFDLDTGACRTTDLFALSVYPVLEVDGRLYADVGDAPPILSWSERLRAHARDGG